MKKLRIAINAQLPSSSGAGGIETVLRVLTALNRLDGDEEYVFVGHHSDSDWLRDLLGERQTIVRAASPNTENQNQNAVFRRLTKPLRSVARQLKNRVAPAPKNKFEVPSSNGFFESLGCDVVHFPYQDYAFCRIPTIYNPHDLQHLHFPQFFAHEEIERREIVYPAACRAAETVVVASQFVKQDVARNYQIDADKIQVIHWSPPAVAPLEFDERAARTLFDKYEVDFAPRPFALYPAMTWEHKNHLRLLEAVALLRQRDGLKINVICTGHKNSFYPRIERRLRELDLSEQIKFVGVVERRELSLFYRAAQFVIIPTLFEAASAPLFEAWQHDVAVACSAITALPGQAATAALLFDPYSVEAIAAAVKTLHDDENLRRELQARGRERLRDFDLTRTLKTYRAVYRKVGGVALTEEDRQLLTWDSMR